MKNEPISFLCLGDSYTIGESVSVVERWPVQLVSELRARGLPVADPVIVAKTGWTTDELMVGIEQTRPYGEFDLVSLLIGVNNQYRGRGIEEYRVQFRQLLAQAIAFAGGKPGKVVVLSIPDWGVTPFTEGYDRLRIATEIDHFNQINRQETEQAGARYIDVTPISRQAEHDPTLITADGLHPSGKMYTAWVEIILPVIKVIF